MDDGVPCEYNMRTLASNACGNLLLAVTVNRLWLIVLQSLSSTILQYRLELDK